MKKVGVDTRLITLLTAFIICFSGCATGKLFVKDTKETLVRKGFLGDSIKYYLSPTAQKYMDDVVVLRKYHISPKEGLLKKLPEDEELKLYDQADKDDDRKISDEEAEEFYHMYSEMYQEGINKIIPEDYKNKYEDKHKKYKLPEYPY